MPRGVGNLFVERGSDRITLRIVDDATRLPRPETLFVPDRGLTAEAKFSCLTASTAMVPTSTAVGTEPLFRAYRLRRCSPTQTFRMLTVSFRRLVSGVDRGCGVDFADMSVIGPRIVWPASHCLNCLVRQ